MDIKFDQEQVLSQLDKLLGVKRKVKPREHKLKWKLAEARLTYAVKDAEATVAALKKTGLKFAGGGEYTDLVHAKDFGGMFAFMIVRTDPKTDEDTIIAETYALNEEEKLGLTVSSGYKFSEDLEEMGYTKAFERAIDVWRFTGLDFTATVYSIKEFGDFIEFALPATNYAAQREKAQEHALAVAAKIGLKKEEAMPTDLLTIQLASMMQEQGGGR